VLQIWADAGKKQLRTNLNPGSVVDITEKYLYLSLVKPPPETTAQGKFERVGAPMTMKGAIRLDGNPAAEQMIALLGAPEVYRISNSGPGVFQIWGDVAKSQLRTNLNPGSTVDVTEMVLYLSLVTPPPKSTATGSFEQLAIPATAIAGKFALDGKPAAEQVIAHLATAKTYRITNNGPGVLQVWGDVAKKNLHTNINPGSNADIAETFIYLSLVKAPPGSTAYGTYTIIP
jgi:hypothetical protein